jgi:hypothetical protein
VTTSHERGGTSAAALAGEGQRRWWRKGATVGRGSGEVTLAPGKWQAAILKAEENRPNLRIVGSG